MKYEMKIFVVGGTGVIGKRLVPSLVKQGHEVAVLSRSSEKSKWIHSQGALPVEVDLFDLEGLMDKAFGYDIYIHTATSIPSKTRPKAKDWEMNTRLRSEGVDNLVKVTLKSNSKLFIKESILFQYGHHPEGWVNEDTKIKIPIPTRISIPKEMENIILLNAIEMENKLLETYREKGLPLIILRFGWLYSHDSSNLKLIASRKMPIIGSGNAYWNMLTVDDASQAIVDTIDNYKDNIGEVFNIVDDEPVKGKDFINYASRVFLGKSAYKIPAFLGRLFAGSYIVNLLMTSRKVSNKKAKDKLNWKPKCPTYKEGIENEHKIIMQNQS